MISPRSYLVSRQKETHHAVGSPSSPSPSSSSSPPRSPVPSKSSYAQSRSIFTSSTRTSSTPAMAFKRKEADTKSPTPSPPKTTTTLTRPTTPTSPVKIPVNSKNETAHSHPHPHKHHRHHGDRRHNHHNSSASRQNPRTPHHNPDAIPASVAALLAITNIPPPRSSRSLRRRAAYEKRMTVDSIIEQSHEAEKEISITLSKSPLDVLLSAPEDLEDDDISICDSTADSILSANTVSFESVPSLTDSFTTGTISSLESPSTPPRRRRTKPTRKSLEPVSSPPGVQEVVHPLSSPTIDVEELDFRVFEPASDASDKKAESRFPFRPLKSAFKSNLTASLRALRNAARSFSNMQLTSIPPEDFLTRSILTLDPRIPYTDERRPPPLEDEPSAALRRYLNPTTSARIESRPSEAGRPAGQSRTAFTASIQMQTYKVSRARSGSPMSFRSPYGSRPTSSGSSASTQKSLPLAFDALPGPRQREVRENPDFIRIAVMEMAMRKNGKLDDRKPGRARLALPPRKMTARPYDIGPDGVPARWVAVTI
ncbi:uncharacterized protein E0L32_009324 [Thyridium curvatum]|uniref:Uncharacterized protein n=1 Tax=Thyridium curvatum TaxID=1093900 RepID=A0A507ARW0_9PEZI|nr:uncharacterized protein E0L32_009324 [Thyridium curvatum]TPX09436.1 hypothetical protein E0L32_009324 [Thyridium curvatum]